MNKRTKANNPNAKTMRAPELCEYLNCGRATAVKIAEEAGAVIHIGRSVLYNVDRISEYMDTIAGEK